MYSMRFFNIFSFTLGLIIHSAEARLFPNLSSDGYVVITHDGPVIIGGTITFRADIYLHDGSRPSGTFSYNWADDALHQHKYQSENTQNVTSFWSITYPAHKYSIGSYRVEVAVEEKDFIFWPTFARGVTDFDVTGLLNGNMSLIQSNKTLEGEYVSTTKETEIKVNLRKGDYDYIVSNATSISTFWFVDCKFFGQTSDFSFKHNFTEPNMTHVVEALVVASHDPIPPTTTIPPTTVSPVTIAPVPNATTTTTTIASTTLGTVGPERDNFSLPFICLNSSIVPPDPNKTYGYFTKELKVRVPVSNITVAGTNWLQPWEMLFLNVSCGGSAPFHKCLMVHRGVYNVTGNETCKENGSAMDTCNFSITHYFLDPSVYTIVMILENDVSRQVYPLTINIYKVTTKPQLSVIVVPVSCSLAALVLIVFGVAYYIQSRARITVEVADFDFGQHNPEMEYKTFTERLRDSFNNTLRPGGDRISVRPPYYGSMYN